MKKIITLILFISIGKISLAQTFLPVGSFWRYCNITWGVPSGGGAPGYTSSTTSFTSYTVETIDGKEIKTLVGTADNVLFTHGFKFYVHGDTTYTFSGTDSTYTLLYNFSFQIGDTLHLTDKNSIRYYNLGLPEDNGYARYKVDSMGTVNIQGDSYRYYTIKYDNSSTANFFQSSVDEMQTFKIIEKMGLVGYVLPIFYGGAWDGAYTSLVYYKNDSTDNFYGTSENICNLSLNDEDVWEGSIFPNPVSEILYVTSPQKQVEFASIVDLQGKVLMSNIWLSPSSTTAIPLSGLSGGIYLLSITTENGNVFIQKIIKN